MSLRLVNRISWLFCHTEWDLVAIETLLSSDNSFINQRIFSKEGALLHFVLKNEKCSPAVVGLLLRYGANVFIEDSLGMTPMEIAIRFKRDEETLLVLVAAGALANEYYPYPPYFCLAVLHQAPMSVIDNIIKSRRGLEQCKIRSHQKSVFKCAMSCPHPNRTLMILKKLLEAGFNVRLKPELLCFSLRYGNNWQTINFLIDNGVIHSSPKIACATGRDLQTDNPSKTFQKCPYHSSFWFCMTSSAVEFLDEGLARILLRFHDCYTYKNRGLYCPIQVVLKECVYEFEAIKLMLDSLRDADLNSFADVMDNSLLHMAVQNKNCLPSAIELLIERGINVNHVNKIKDTALDEAVLNSNCPENVRIILLKNGLNLNPRSIALAQSDTKLLKLLLATGISLGKTRHLHQLKHAAISIHCDPKLIIYFQYLLRYYLLECSEFDLPFLKTDHTHFSNIIGYRDRCVDEVMRLKSQKIGPANTASDLLGKNSALRGAATNTEDKMPDFNRLLEAISGDSFPLYRYIIVDKVTRPVLEKKIYQTKVYASKFVGNKRIDIGLNCDCLRVIVQHLEDADLFNLISAYFKRDPSIYQSYKDSHKRITTESAEEPLKLFKLVE